MKMVKFDGAADEVGVACCVAVTATAAEKMPARVSACPRLKWNEGMSQHSSYHAARAALARVDRSDRAWLVVSGNDRRSYLQGLLTNDIEALGAGRGCYAAYLTPQGRMIADLWVYELGDVILLSMIRDVKATVLARLDQFVFTEDVQLGDVSETFAAVAIVGPRAADAVAAATGISTTTVAALPEHGNLRTEFHTKPAIILRTTDTGLDGFDLVVDAAQRDEVIDLFRASGAVDLDAATAEALRIEAGIPKFHRDMDEETIPLEAGIEGRAISQTKGCYVGQEVIVRVLHRGHGRVARRLVGLAVEGDSAPAAGSAVQIDGKQIGSITSAAYSPALHRPIALGYVQRDHVEPGTAVTVGGAAAVVTATPFTR
jgi:folate-binding protein YgfZ